MDLEDQNYHKILFKKLEKQRLSPTSKQMVVDTTNVIFKLFQKVLYKNIICANHFCAKEDRHQLTKCSSSGKLVNI